MNYALRAEKSKRSRRQHNHQVDQIKEEETGLETFLENHKIETKEQQEDPTGLEINLEAILVIGQMIEQEMAELILNRNPTNIVNTVIKMVILGNTSRRGKSL